MKKFIPTIVVSLIVLMIGIIVLMAFNSRTIFNDDETSVGNTGGNLNNGGYFCEYEDKVYFSNLSDNGALYVMDSNQDNFKKLSGDTVSSINVSGKYIYYARNNSNNEGQSFGGLKANFTGVYRLNKNGKKLLSLLRGESKVINVIGNYVYCLTFDKKIDDFALQKVKINSSDKSVLSRLAINPASSFNGRVYYTGVDKDHHIYSLDLASNISRVVLDENCHNSVIHNGQIYYISLQDNYAIARVDLDGLNKEILVDEFCSTFNVTDNYLYYQVDDNENSKLCMNNLEGTNQVTIMEGNFNSINITSNYVYFKHFKSNSFYQVPLGIADGVTLFTAPTDDK